MVAERETPIAPQVILPTFDAMAPTGEPDAPTDLAGKFTLAYRENAPSFFSMLEGHIDAHLSKVNPRFHEQMGAIEDKLAGYLQGGTALTPATQSAIHERTRDKVNAEFRRARDTAYSDAARRGLTIPDGALFSAVRQSRQDGADANARAVTEIAIKQAELEQANMQFAISASAQLRSSVIQSAIAYHQGLISLNGQAVEAARDVLGAIVQAYNVSVQAFGARLDAYKAEASVYEARLRAVMTHIEKYRAEIQALEALTQVDTTRVNAYRAKIDAMGALADIYRTQVDAVISRAGLEKLKIDAFGAQVQSYQARVQGYTAAWQGYGAAVNGEEAKAKIYAEQIGGFRALVDAGNAMAATYKTRVDALIDRANLQKLKLESFSAQVQAYSAQVQGANSEWQGFESQVRAEDIKVRIYSERLAGLEDAGGHRRRQGQRLSGAGRGHRAEGQPAETEP